MNNNIKKVHRIRNIFRDYTLFLPFGGQWCEPEKEVLRIFSTTRKFCSVRFSFSIRAFTNFCCCFNTNIVNYACIMQMIISWNNHSRYFFRLSKGFLFFHIIYTHTLIVYTDSVKYAYWLQVIMNKLNHMISWILRRISISSCIDDVTVNDIFY